jgi:hypothetical protein
MRILIFILYGLLLSGSAAVAADKQNIALADDVFAPRPDNGPRTLPGMLAIALTPRNFPDHSIADTDAMFKLGAELGRGAVFIYQWSDPALKTIPRVLLAAAKESGLTPIVGLSPTSLDKSRKELDLPATLRKPGVSFDDPEVRRAFVAAAEELAKFEPPYLCLGTEINFFALNGAKAYVGFAAAYKEAYRAVKKISPSTKVYVSFQYEFLRLLDHKEPDKLDEHRKLIDVFRPELDLVAITTYPVDAYDEPGKMPSNYYAHVRRYLQKDDAVMVMEVGWPSAGQGSTEQQRAFVKRLPELLAEVKPVLTAWSMLHDVKQGVFGADLATTGLYTGEGEAKPAAVEWKALGAK